jgi:hypothetical protein
MWITERRYLLLSASACLMALTKEDLSLARQYICIKKENLFIAKPPLAYFAENQQC